MTNQTRKKETPQAQITVGDLLSLAPGADEDAILLLVEEINLIHRKRSPFPKCEQIYCPSYFSKDFFARQNSNPANLKAQPKGEGKGRELSDTLLSGEGKGEVSKG